MSRLIQWAGEWVETLRIAPPFSKQRRHLLAVLNDDNDPWVEVGCPGGAR